jgi:GNAT superfamily N-acetyltransferase
MARYDVNELTTDGLDDAARLLAERHRLHRRAIPALDPAYEDQAVARSEIAALLGSTDASGVIATSEQEASAFLLGTRRPDAIWGPNIWIEAAGNAGPDGEALREAYAVAAGVWVDEGRTSHFVVVPASDTALIEAWFSLGFGKQHVHGLRRPPPQDFEPVLEHGLTVRRATRADIPMLAVLDRALPRHQAAAPVFSRLPELTVEQARADIEADFDDPDYTTFVALLGGKVIGASVACSLDLSPGNTSTMRPRSCGLLGFAAVLPEARGLGAGRALGATTLCWARDEGYKWVGADWRSTNLLANRSWLALGFRPSFYRLHRLIG